MPELDLEQALRDLPRPSFKQKLRERMQPQTLTPYIVVGPVDEVIDFVKDAFGAEEILRSTGSAGGTHCEVRIGDSRLMIGGGANLAHKAMPTMLHLYVRDVDAAHRRAIDLGGKSLMEPTDQGYGDRDSVVADPGGNQWCLATSTKGTYKPEMMRDVTLYLHPHGAGNLIDFLSKAFGAETLERHAAPDGTLIHAKVRVGNTIVEMGEAHGEWAPQPTMLHVLVADTDAAYARAIAAGAKSLNEPADNAYVGRMAAVEDPAGNQWYMAAGA
jgi:uncharacterized glyoxalase superfamily protein PhnB